jgi:hypothetical protein
MRQITVWSGVALLAALGFSDLSAQQPLATAKSQSPEVRQTNQKQTLAHARETVELLESNSKKLSDGNRRMAQLTSSLLQPSVIGDQSRSRRLNSQVSQLADQNLKLLSELDAGWASLEKDIYQLIGSQTVPATELGGLLKASLAAVGVALEDELGDDLHGGDDAQDAFDRTKELFKLAVQIMGEYTETATGVVGSITGG